MNASLDNQLCFLLYVSSKEIIKDYTVRLKQYDLTYTGYITMLALSHEEPMTIKELGSKLFLDSGTLTPLLKRLETHGYVTRARSKEDERNLLVSLTDEGFTLREELGCIGEDVFEKSSLDTEQAKALHAMLSQFVASLDK